MKSKRSKACEISQKVKEIVWLRDNKSFIFCGRYVPKTCACCHFIARSHGGLGIEKNILTLCNDCHYMYDNTDKRKKIKELFRQYLKEKYQDWDEKELVYNKWKNFGKI